MSLAISRKVSVPFEEAVRRVTDALKTEGFGVLTEIDLEGTLQQKLGVDVQPYRILGACNPQFAHRALQIEPDIGVLLPCNVIVRTADGGGTVVSAVDPMATVGSGDDERLLEVAKEVRARLERALDVVAAAK